MSFDLVLFGGTGDLTWRKLMPALFQAFSHGKLPPGGRLLAVARDERSDEEYRAFIRERFAEVDPSKRPSDEEFGRLAQLVHYRRMDLSRPEDYSGAEAVGASPRRRHRGALSGHQPASVPGDLRTARSGRAERAADPRRARKAARPRSRERAGNQSRGACQLQRGAGLSHRSLPRQARGAEPDGAAFRQRAVRAAVASRKHREHRDHVGRKSGGRHARRFLRSHRRAARHDPKPCAAAADDGRDGAAVEQRRRCDP